MATINISGAGATPPNGEPKSPLGAGPTDPLAAVNSAAIQDALRQMKYLASVKNLSFSQERQLAQAAARDRKAEISDALYLAQVKKKSLAEQINIERQEARQAETRFAADISRVNRLASIRRRSMASDMADERRKEREAERFEREQAKQKDAAFKKSVRDFQYLRKVREQSERDEAAPAEAARKARMDRLRSYGRLARTSAMVLEGVHGNFEGITTGVGGLAGLALGGAVGGEIGEVIGEVVGKVVTAAIKLPMAPGNLWNSYMGMAKPYFDLQRAAMAVGGAGGFSGQGLLDNGVMTGDYGASTPQWRKALGVTSTGYFQDLAGVGVTPRSPAEADSLVQDLNSAAYTSGFRAIGKDQLGALLGAGISTGATTPSGASEFLNGFSNLLQKGVPLNIDQSKLLAKMQDSLDTLAKNGGDSINAASMRDTFLQFMMSGTPTGKSGEAAANYLGGIANAIGDVDSPSAMATFARFMAANGGMDTREKIENAMGPAAVAQAKKNPALFDRRIAYFLNARKEGGIAGAFEAYKPLGGSDQAYYGSAVQNLFGGDAKIGTDYWATKFAASGLEVNANDLVAQSVGAKQPSGDGGADLVTAKLHFKMGTSTESDVKTVLQANGYTPDEIKTALDEARGTPVNAIKIAMWHKGYEMDSVLPSAMRDRYGVDANYARMMALPNMPDLANAAAVAQQDSILSGSKVEAGMLGPAMMLVTNVAGDAATVIRKLADAFDGLKNAQPGVAGMTRTLAPVNEQTQRRVGPRSALQ